MYNTQNVHVYYVCVCVCVQGWDRGWDQEAGRWTHERRAQESETGRGETHLYVYMYMFVCTYMFTWVEASLTVTKVYYIYHVHLVYAHLVFAGNRKRQRKREEGKERKEGQKRSKKDAHEHVYSSACEKAAIKTAHLHWGYRVCGHNLIYKCMYIQVPHMPTQSQWLLGVLWTLTLVPRSHYYRIFFWAEERKEGKERQERERPDSRQVNAWCFIHCAALSSNTVQYLYDALLQQNHRRSVHRTGQGGHCYQVSQDATLRVCRGVQVHCAYTHEYILLSKTSPQD